MMQAADVLAVLRAVQIAGVAVWLDGGWGVDAALGTQTRDHEDVDIVITLDDVDSVCAQLAPLGYALAEDHLPTRAVLRSDDGRQVDVHPVIFDEQGTGWQRAAAPDGSDCPYPPDGFGHGNVGGERVPCLTAALLLEHHTGYEPRERDRADVGALSAAFDLPMPAGY